MNSQSLIGRSFSNQKNVRNPRYKFRVVFETGRSYSSTAGNLTWDEFYSTTMMVTT